MTGRGLHCHATPVSNATLPLAYRILVGINYGARRAEPGDVVSDLPRTSLAWLLREGVIERVEEEEGEDGR